jgi:sortase (surface protein transpeptidase)
LTDGDEVLFFSPFRRYTYRVMRSFTVTPDRVDVVASTEAPTLTLTACHPPYSARLRLIVQAELIEVRRLVDTAGREVEE